MPRFELHCHSTCSDGTESPAAVAARAAARGVEVFALTDHDTCEGSAVEVPGARVMRAVEISAGDGDRTIHVLAYDRGGAGWRELEARLAEVRGGRTNRLRTMAARLAQRGIHIDIEPLLAAAGTRSVGRPDLARAMVAVGAASSVKDAFNRHLFDGGPVDVKHHAVPFAEALALGRAAGAAMSLAHPHLYDQRSYQLLRAHHGDGLTGVEAFYGAYDNRERARWIKLADDLRLVCTGGSDWHGPGQGAGGEPGIELGDDRAARLREWLQLS